MHFFAKAPILVERAVQTVPCFHNNGKCGDGPHVRVSTSPTMQHLEEMILATACSTHRTLAIVDVTRRADTRYREIHEEFVVDHRDRFSLTRKTREYRGVLVSGSFDRSLRRDTMSLVAAVSGA
jgi:hypothetical protein